MLPRYVFALLWPRALFVVILGVVLFTVLDSMETARWLANGTAVDIAVFYACRTPEVMQQMMGAAVVLGLLATLGTLNRRAELASMSAAGLPMTRTLLPAALWLAGGAAAMHAFLSEVVVPPASVRAMELAVQTFKMGGGRHAEFYARPEWFKAGPIYARAQPGPNGRYEQVMGVVVDDAGHVTQRFTAAAMVPADDGRFLLEGAVLHTLLPSLRFERAAEKQMHMPEAAAALTAPMGYPESYRLFPLWDAVKRRAAGGRDAAPYRLALLRRLGDPLMVVLLGLLAVPLAVRQRREATVERLLFVGGIAVGAAQLMMMAGDMLAGKDVLPPWVAAGAAPVLLGLVTAWLWSTAERSKAAR
jgi:lipopolysaccharide export LptBFGC system permease protein LptF